MLIDAVYNGLISAGLPCLLLGLAVWFMTKRADTAQAVAAQSAKDALATATQAAKDAQVTQMQFIAALNTEREERILQIEKQNAECEKDRFSLREQLIDLLKQDRTVVRSLDPAATQKIPLLDHGQSR